MAVNMNILVGSTAAQSPWSHGINERNSVSLSWAVRAKNALSISSGLSQNQIVFGYDPSVPNERINQFPA